MQFLFSAKGYSVVTEVVTSQVYFSGDCLLPSVETGVIGKESE